MNHLPATCDGRPEQTPRHCPRTDTAARLVQDDEAADGAVEDSRIGGGDEHGVAEGDAAPADLQVRNVDAEDLAGLEGRGIAGVEPGAFVRLEADRVPDVAALESR